jgi:3,4-dihydroxy 2-butanone 4-phosphate synthase / GTP cyclohydrolase II
MVYDNENPREPAYTVTVDAAEGGTTGISASDRARTMRLLADPHTRASDLTRPGHILPLRGVPRGLLGRRGFTEAALELVRLAGLEPAAAVCELVSLQAPRYMPSADETMTFVREHRLNTIPMSVLVSSAKTRFGALPR